MGFRKIYGFIILVLCLALAFAGCEDRSFVSTTTPDHPGYLDSVFKPLTGIEIDSTKHERLIDSAYNALKDPGPGDKWDRYYYLYAYTYLDQGNYHRAILYTDSMLLALDKLESNPAYIERYAKALFYKGDVLLSWGRYAESFSYYYKAREVIYQKGDPCILSEYSSRLAAATFRQERFLDATDFYKQAVREMESCPIKSSGRFGEIQGTLDNIGIAYVRAGMIDSADLYFNKALAYIDANIKFFPDRQEHFADIAKAVIYGNQAGVAIKRKKYDVAEKLLKESIRISTLPGHPDEDAGYSLIKLIRIYLEQHRLNDAEKQLGMLAVISRKYASNSELITNYALLQAKYLGLKGDNAKAYQYLVQYQHMTDSVQQQNAPRSVTDMKQAIDNISRQYELEILAKDNKLKSDYLWLTIVILTMAIAIVVLIWINYRRYKRNVVALVDLNDVVNNKNQALLHTLAALEQSHNNNTRLLKVVAHDLRGPLGAITSIAELAGDGMLPGEKYQEVMAIIFRSGTKALTLANHLLVDMQTIGKLTNPEPLNIGEKLSSCIELYTHKIKEKELKAILETIPAFVNGEREKLWRVFSNLISNAVKFSRIGGEIRIAMHVTGAELIVSVKDNGIGIPDDLKDRIFEPTEATTRAGTLGERSFGLGLSISKNIISLHDGTIWFESSYLEGTTFFVSLPLLRMDNEPKTVT